MDKMLKDMQMFAGMLLIALIIAFIGTVILAILSYIWGNEEWQIKK